MTILVTGGAGFIGTNLCLKFLKEGHKVVAVDNFITGSKSNLRVLRGYPNFTFIKWDITKPFTRNQLPATCDQIYHLACPTGVENIGPLAEEMLLTCSLGTKNILDLAKETKAKILFTSSSEVYGNPQVFPQSEDYSGNVDPIGFRSPYEEGKRFSESQVSMYVRKYNLDAKIVRVFNTYGPFMSESDSRVIPRFLSQALKNIPLTVHGRGDQKRTFCFVDDLVKGLETVMEKGAKGQVYNLGSSQQIAILDLAKLIIKVSNSKSTIRFTKRPLHDHQSRLPDLSKIKRLGWQPKTELEEGIKKTIKTWHSYSVQ